MDGIPQELREALAPLLNALAINESDTLGQYIPDQKVIYTGENGYAGFQQVTVGDLRRLRDVVHALDTA